MDVLSAMVAALGHDIGHPGVNNMYFQKTKHPISQTVNDQAVLENYHCYMLTFLLSKPENDILSRLTEAEKTRFRKATIDAILGTDMTKHFVICQAFDRIVQ